MGVVVAPILAAALDLAGRGWLVVPVHTHGKNPYPAAWQKAATTDLEVIEDWWRQWPDANVGVKLGKDSGLIDIECDSQEADAVLLGMFGGEFPTTPTFVGKRGKHRLFRWRDDLPHADKAVWKIGKLEFRTGGGDKGAQSVFPPSIHPSGETYKWVIHPDECDGVAEIPEALIAKLWNANGEDLFSKPPTERKEPSVRERLYHDDEVPEGGRDETLYAEACALWAEKFDRYGAGVFDDAAIHSRIYKTIWAWNRAMCRPPLDDAIIQQKVNGARDFIRRAKYDAAAATIKDYTIHGLEWRAGEWWPGEWLVVIVLSDPPAYRLTVPAWRNMIGGEGVIELSSESYAAPPAVAQAIFAATKRLIVDDQPGRWTAIWNGTKGNKKDGVPPSRGLKAKLLDGAKTEVAPAEWKRIVTLADLLADKLSRASAREQPESRGDPVRLPDGSIWMRWAKIWQNELAMKIVKPGELILLSRRLGIGVNDSRRARIGSQQVRFTVLSSVHIQNLDDLRESSSV